MGQGIKLWDGSKWVQKNDAVRIWNGNSWQKAKVKLWTAQGEGFRTVSETRYQKTWEATWTQGYWGSGASKPNYRLSVANRLMQGRYGEPWSQEWEGGIQGGMMGFDDNDIRNSLSGAAIEKVELYLHSQHWWYYAGGTAIIGCHNARGWQGWFQEINYNVARQRYTTRDQGFWITLPNWVGDNFRDNKLAGITTHANSSDPWYYGYFHGTNDGWKKPKLRITYRK